MINSSGDKTMIERGANGLRRSPLIELTDDDIKALKNDIKEIGADESVFKFNTGSHTAYRDSLKRINIRGDVFPDKQSLHPRDLMSERAVLAHEYYGHYMFALSKFEPSDWRDEMRASYVAAVKTPNLSDDDRKYLMLDAYERAREAGYNFKYSKKARLLIYGY